MDEGVRSTGPSGVLVKTRNSSGCLIVRKKGDGLGGVGSSSSRLPSLDSKKEKKRPRLILSDSGSSDEILLPQRGRFGPETIRVCNGLNSFEKGGVEERRDIRRNNRLQYGSRDEDALVDGMDEDGLQRSMGSLDVFEFNEYDDDGEKRRKKHFNGSGDRRFHGSSSMNGAVEREFDSGSSRYVVDKRKSLYLDQTSSFDRERSSRKINFDTNNNGAHLPVSLLREKSRGKSDEAIRVQGKNGVLKVMVNKKKNAHRPLDIYDHKLDESRKSLRTEDSLKRKVLVASSVYPETKPLERQDPFPKPEKDHTDFQTSAPTKNGKGCSLDSGNSSVSLKPRKKVSEAPKSTKRASSEVEITPCEETPPSTMKEGKVKRGSGTEKQKLRERIREMLLSSGWKIDYRPRRNRDYLDAVYVNPAGTAYWSIIKAYDALQKQSNEEGAEAKPSADGSFMPISDDILSQLTRKTRKKMEKERKNKRRDDSDSENAKEASTLRSGGTKYDMDSMDSDSNEEKLSSYIKQGGKSIKNKVNENGFPSVNSKGQSSNKHLRDTAVKLSSGSNSRILHGRKGKKLGLMVRGSSRGLDSENDGFVPYTGKRTLLSWLIDSGTVQLSQKVRYMNRRQTRVMLEGWITRDGIHCGCCSKILTVSKFEIHAGSKLRQPFQNIFLESGVSLLQCQIDAWNRQEESKRLGFHTVEIDGDDPNDDTCGICADGGDLICCDGCPSTFHQSCLEIQIPPGDWHCPNCTCKFCGVASVDVSHGDNTIVPVISSCMLCEKKFHESCIQDMDALTCSNGSVSSFCGKNCGELFENLQKYLGARHELDAGFSWSLIRRTNEDSDASLRGLSQRIECNSKLAVALTVMDECFLPIVDRRSGINLIHNVLYNCGSNFYRLNYSGFYTAILERGDEIISAATIRFHGTKLAEMPFIGTRHIYRRQGMCRRLFCAIESALRLLKVEMLIIPAIAELMHTWTVIFGFSPLEQSLKQEMRLINMLVFPGTDMLQKLLTEEKVVEENVSTGSGAKKMRSKSEEFTSPKMDTEALSEHEPQSHNDTEQNHFEVTTNEVAVTGTSVADNSLDHEVRTSLLPVETINPDSHSDDKLAKCASDKKCSSPSDADARYDSPAETGTHLESVSASQNYTSVVNSSFHHEVRSTLLPVETITSDSHSENKLAKCASDRKYSSPSDADARYDSPPAETGTHPESISVSQNDTSVANSSLDHKVRILLLPVETINSDSPSENKLAKCSSALAADARYDSSPAGNSPQRDHCIEDHKHSTPQCMEVGTSVMSSSSDGFHESKVTVSEKGIIGSNSHVGHNLAGPGSEKKSFPSVIDNGTDEVENTPVMDSPEDDKSSNKTSDHDIRDFQPVMDYPEDDKSSNKISGHDIREVDADVNFLKTAHLVETFAESAVKENSVVSASGLNGTSGRPFEIISDLNNSMASGKESKLSAASESTFDAMHCSESSPHSSGAKSRGDSQEVRVESGSI